MHVLSIALFVSAPWITQHASTKRFTFAASCVATDETCRVEAIAVKEQGKIVPTIPLDASGSGACEDVVGTRDVNFDGAPDLLIVARGGTSVIYEVEVFDSVRGAFARDDKLSSLPQLTIDGPASEIHSATRDGAAHHIAERYAYIDGQLTLLESIDRDCRSGAPCTVTTRRRAGSDYKTSKSKKCTSRRSKAWST